MDPTGIKCYQHLSADIWKNAYTYMQCGAKIKKQESILVISEVSKDLATGFSRTETAACL